MAAGIRCLLRCTPLIDIGNIYRFTIYNKAFIWHHVLDADGRVAPPRRADDHCDVVAPGDRQTLEAGGELD
jgi:hypothetical protein